MGNLASTAATLTRAGQKLADILIDPRAVDWTGPERAYKAGISVSQYRRLMANEEFQLAFQACCQEMLAPHIPHVLAAAIETAKTPGRDGFKDREMLLRMGGAYLPAEARKFSGDGDAALKVEFIAPQANQGQESRSSGGRGNHKHTSQKQQTSKLKRPEEQKALPAPDEG